MTRYSVGDVVTVRSDLVVGTPYRMAEGGSDCYFTGEMSQLMGMCVTIAGIFPGPDCEPGVDQRYMIKEMGWSWMGWSWVDEMFEDSVLEFEDGGESLEDLFGF